MVKLILPNRFSRKEKLISEKWLITTLAELNKLYYLALDTNSNVILISVVKAALFNPLRKFPQPAVTLILVLMLWVIQKEFLLATIQCATLKLDNLPATILTMNNVKKLPT